jgi:hypothetical protein
VIDQLPAFWFAQMTAGYIAVAAQLDFEDGFVEMS